MKLDCRRALTMTMALLTTAAVFVSCGETAENAPVLDSSAGTEAPVTEETEPVNERLAVKDSLPEGLDYGGKEFQILYTNGMNRKSYVEGAEEENGDIVEDAVINSTRAVEERLNVDIVHTSNDEGDWSNSGTIIKKLVMAGDTTYDLYMGEQFGVVQVVPDGVFANGYDIANLDFTKPWWNNTFMDNLSVGSSARYLLTGDYNLTVLLQAFVIYYNKSMYARLYDDANALYDTVLSGKWTMDRLSEITREAFTDLDNNGKTNEGDQLGFLSYKTSSAVDPFMYLADIPYTTRDSSGAYTLNMQQERAVKLTEKVVDFFWQEGSCSETETKVETLFSSGSAMFLDGLFSTAKELRDMKEDFGFLPIPKLDEEQESYRCLVGDCPLLCGVPTTCQNTDMVGAVLEALNAETYKTVTPVWYETALKIKYARDDISSQIIDLIRDSMTTSFIFAYSPKLSNIGQIMRELVSTNSKNYMSKAASMEKSANKSLAKLVEAFEENG